MAFSAYTPVPGNYLRTRRLALLCDVSQCIELTQRARVCLSLPAAAPGEGCAVTAIRAQRLLNHLACGRTGNLRFETRPGAPPLPWPLRVAGCELKAESAAVAGQEALYVYWRLSGTFTLCDAEGCLLVLADGPLQMLACAARGADLGSWQVAIAASCLGCTVVCAGSDGCGPAGVRSAHRSAGAAPSARLGLLRSAIRTL